MEFRQITFVMYGKEQPISVVADVDGAAAAKSAYKNRTPGKENTIEVTDVNGGTLMLEAHDIAALYVTKVVPQAPQEVPTEGADEAAVSEG